MAAAFEQEQRSGLLDSQVVRSNQGTGKNIAHGEDCGPRLRESSRRHYRTRFTARQEYRPSYRSQSQERGQQIQTRIDGTGGPRTRGPAANWPRGNGTPENTSISARTSFRESQRPTTNLVRQRLRPRTITPARTSLR